MTPLQAASERAHDRDVGHVDHIRLSWHVLGDSDGEEEAVALVRETLLAVSVWRHGDTGTYHETMTRAFMRLINAGRSALPSTHSFDEFCLMYPELLREDALALYYSRETLLCEQARIGWIDPDLRALPSRAD